MRNTRALAFTAAAFATALSISLWFRAPDSAPASDTALELETRVRATCSTCHRFPTPDILPRHAWRNIIQHMAFLRKYLREETFSRGFSVDEVTEWFETRAPETMPVEYTLTRKEPAPLRFRRRFLRLGPESGPGVATVERLEPGLIEGADPILAAPNMSNGGIHLYLPARGSLRVGEAQHPARVTSGDLDGDGLADLMISDLGDPMPNDERLGRLIVGVNMGHGGFAFETVLDKIGRVADARPADLDGDGDLDIVVAAFGWLRSGGIYLLFNRTRPGGPLDFRVEKISHRSGAVSALPVEGLDMGPGRGIAVAFSQHYELVSVFYQGNDGYEEHVVYRAPHPNWGMDNLQALDFDGDSDVDFLLAHGDTLDDGLPFKFYHGVEWLENRGNGVFRAHRIGSLYGAHSAEAVDLDGDGDLDVVASGFLPQVLLPVPRGPIHIDSVIWFERTEREWIPWSIEANHPRHTSMTVVDLDRDGLPDIVAAINRAWDLEKKERGPSLEIWLNEGPR